MKETADLFEEFSSEGLEEWKEQVARDIDRAGRKGPLTWKTGEGFEVEPFYTDEDIEGLSYLTGAMPGEYPFLRGNGDRGNNWDICVRVGGKNTAQSNELARKAFMNGADSVTFEGIPASSVKELSRLLRGIPLGATKLNFEPVADNLKLIGLLTEESEKQNIDPSKLAGTLYFSPLSDLLSEGFLPLSSEECFVKTKDLLVSAGEQLPGYRTLAVKGDGFSEAGANIVQELAFSLSAGCEYLVKLREKGLDATTVLSRMVFRFSTGSSYFMEIAKLRAARILWAKIAEKFSPRDVSSFKMTIHCMTSLRNKTLYDPYVNVLRGTAESMAAIMGGCSLLCVLPFDHRSGTEEDSSVRLAHNTQLILKEESYLHKVADPGAGSYYIEKLTGLISAEALELFQEVERKGGFIQCVNSSYIQDQIIKTRDSKMERIKSGKGRIVGTNRSPDLDEKIMDQMGAADKTLSAGEKSTGGDAGLWKVRKLEKISWAGPYEDLRLRTERFETRAGRVPRAFLLKMGDPAFRSARAVFSANFFGCAGYAVTEGKGPDGMDEGIDEAAASGADIVVLCSSDKDYAEAGAEVVRRIKKALPEAVVVVAGYPRDVIDELTASGVDDFIHMNSNLYETLSKYHKRLGVD